MSKERELLKKILATGWLNNTISCEVEELLTQPEQAPSVKLPDSEDEAVMMNLLSDNWLRRHAPHRLNQPEQEPVAWITEWVQRYRHNDTPIMDNAVSFTKGGAPAVPNPNYIPLYTAPPKREPLSDDEMRAIWKEGIRGEIPFVEIGRAIEKAHGITGEKNE